MKSTHFAFVALAIIACANATAIGEDVTPATNSRRLMTQTDAELGEYFEGDMILSKEQMKIVNEGIHVHNGIIDVTKRWPNNAVVYQISDDYNAEQTQIINNALAEIANRSCITFRARQGNEHAVVIADNGRGCYSYLGYTTTDPSGEPIPFQKLNIAVAGCMVHGIVVHEMLHTLGFFHMQSTYNRNDYVRIERDNILEGKEHNFKKYKNDTVTDFGVEYDYGSIMHYGAYAFSKNGQKTIVPLQEGAVIGQRERMSDGDVLKLKRMYGCAE